MTGMIDRSTDVAMVRTALKRSRVVALLGPRHCGKTTLARQFVPADSLSYFELEDLLSLARLSELDFAPRLIPNTCRRKRVNSRYQCTHLIWNFIHVHTFDNRHRRNTDPVRILKLGIEPTQSLLSRYHCQP